MNAVKKYITILIFIGFDTIAVGQIADSIIFHKKINNTNFNLTLELGDKEWVRDSSPHNDMVLYNPKDDLKMVFGGGYVSNYKFDDQFSYIKYFVKNFNREYDPKKIIFSFSPNKNYISSIYNDLTNSFISYCYYYKNYYIFVMVYGDIKRNDNKFQDSQIQKQLNVILQNYSLMITND